MNTFLEKIYQSNTTTENGAISHSSTGNVLSDQFSKAGSYRNRPIDQVFNEQSQLDSYDSDLAIKYVFYLRMITRKINPFAYGEGNVFESEKVQKGQGNRDESFKRFLWYAVNKPEIFYENLWFFIPVGRQQDIYDIMFLANTNNIDIDVNRIISEISINSILFEGVDPSLFKKYLPLVKSNYKVKTSRAIFMNNIAKRIQKSFGLNAKQIRKMKTTGKAHEWQKLISNQLYSSIDFNKISGKALLKLISSKFLKNQKLEEKYLEWIQKQPVAKFNGFPYELGAKVTYNLPLTTKITIDKQFEGLLKTSKESELSNRKVVCAIDRSGSMNRAVAGTTAMNIAESLGIYFSSLLEGDFKDWVIKFSRRSEWIKLNGSFTDKKLSMKWGDCPSNTDFQSIIDSFVTMKTEHPSIKEEDFPNTLLIVSDMQFDSNGTSTNYQTAISKLSQVFSKEWVDNFVFIWWDCTGRVSTNQPQSINEPGGYVFSGFDGSVINILLGSIDNNVESKPTMVESIGEILDQDILKLIKSF